nr:MAG TPA: hypothetical protein [Caudoviricetes sp.]
MRQIQATIVGFSGKPATLFSAYDNKSGVLVIAVDSEYRRERREGAIVVSNDVTVDRDAKFGEENILNAIKAYYLLKTGVAIDGKSSRLIVQERAMRANPESGIERDGVDANGARYRVSDAITNLQMAALATCLQAINSDQVDITLSLLDQVQEMKNQPMIITI